MTWVRVYSNKVLLSRFKKFSLRIFTKNKNERVSQKLRKNIGFFNSLPLGVVTQIRSGADLDTAKQFGEERTLLYKEVYHSD